MTTQQHRAQILKWAEIALYSSAFTGTKLMCSKFCRQVFEAANAPGKTLFRGTARLTCRAWRAAGLTFVPKPGEAFIEGDLLFKYGGVFGHVGIYVGKGLIYHNTVGTGQRTQGNKTISTLAQFGRVDEVGRIK